MSELDGRWQAQVKVDGASLRAGKGKIKRPHVEPGKLGRKARRVKRQLEARQAAYEGMKRQDGGRGFRKPGSLRTRGKGR